MFFIKISLRFYIKIRKERGNLNSYKCFNHLPTSLNWNFIRKKRENRKNLKPKERHIETKKKIGWIPKMLLVTLPKHCKISCEILFPLQCDLLNPSLTNVGDSRSTKPLKPQLTRSHKKHSTPSTLCCPTDCTPSTNLQPHSHFPPHPQLPTPAKHRLLGGKPSGPGLFVA